MACLYNKIVLSVHIIKTGAPQTVHNTPVVNIFKRLLLYNTFLKEMHLKKTKSNLKLSSICQYMKV